MTRRRLLGGTYVSLCLLAAGCASHAAPAPLTADARPVGGDSLRASVEWSKSRRGHLTVRVDRPAYVALFEIRRGFGVSLVHPVPGSGDVARVPAGELHVQAERGVVQRGLYASDPVPFKTVGPGDFFLVASTEPLDLTPFAETSSRPGQELGHLYTSRRTREVMVALARRVLPDGKSPASRTTAAVTPLDVQLRPLDATELP